MRLTKLEFGLIGLASMVVITAIIHLFPTDKLSNRAATKDVSYSPALKEQKHVNTGDETGAGTAPEAAAKNIKKKGTFSRDAAVSTSVTAAKVQVPAVLTPAQEAKLKAVESWETLVDKLVELKDAPTKERMAEVKEAFDKLDKKDQMDAVQRAVNLLPDEQFSSLYGILFDKSENAEVLDTIFSDGLNRPEDIKVPMMKELVVDKEHPMFFESARILDVTGELDKMTGTTLPATEEDDTAQETGVVKTTPVDQAVPAADAKVTP